MQAVVVPLGDGQEVQAEPGALLYMAGGVDMESRMSGGLLGGLRRLMAGESLFMTRFRGRGEGQVAFAAPYPGKLKQLDLTGAPNWLCQRDSFLCATDGIDVGIAFTKRFGAGLFGGEGFILEKLTGAGTVFIHAGGNLIEFDLLPGQSMRVDTGCIVAFEEWLELFTEDVTERRGLEQQFRQAQNRSRAMPRAADWFLRDVTHRSDRGAEAPYP